MTHDPVVIRAASSRKDLAAIERVDLSYSTDCIYRVRRAALAFSLEAERLSPPARRTYARPALEPSDNLVLASVGDQVIGFGELQYEDWNRRARIEHLYVSGGFRGKGAGRALLGALESRARELSARCLWLETQNVNYPAIQFYLRMGFQLCGLDESLYQPGAPGIEPGDVALYFTREIVPARRATCRP